MAYEQPAPGTTTESVTKRIVRMEAQRQIIKYADGVLTRHKDISDIHNKFDAIDIAYARYKRSKQNATLIDGQDPLPDGETVCNIFEADDVTPPIVVSQVDSWVAYLAEVFLSGAPLFPVVSAPSKRQRAEELEALIDDHATLGAYPRHLLMFLRDCGKYNFGACEVDWDAISQFSVLADIASDKGQKVTSKPKKFTRITRLNPRNVVWDNTVAIGDIAEHGDYAGYIDRITKTKLKRMLNKFTAENCVLNADKAMNSSSSSSSGYTPNYTENPLISKYITNSQTNRRGVHWDEWFDPAKGTKRQPASGQMYERFVLYARIMPADFGISAPAPNTPQIWKFIIINGQHVVYANRIISAYDYLPILFGSPLEDGMDYQTQSVAESEIAFQDAANTLFNIRFAAARRAVSDRALYIPDMIKPSDINSPAAAPKIPVHISQLSSKKIGDAYAQIPFDMRGTESTIQDASLIIGFSKELHGINGPRAGNFQKGNKSVKEWDDTMGGSDGRLRLPALTLEHQFFSPLKSIIVLNIYQYGDDAIIVSQATGREMNIKIKELRESVLSFRVADGYTPKSKLASTEVILAGMQMIGNSPILQQQFGSSLPAMFVHFMSLSGVKGFEQYDPAVQQQQANPNLGAAGNMIQPAVLPNPAAATQPAPVVNTQPVV